MRKPSSKLLKAKVIKSPYKPLKIAEEIIEAGEIKKRRTLKASFDVGIDEITSIMARELVEEIDREIIAQIIALCNEISDIPNPIKNFNVPSKFKLDKTVKYSAGLIDDKIAESEITHDGSRDSRRKP